MLKAKESYMVLSDTEFSGIFFKVWVVMMINAKDTNSILQVFLSYI